MIFSGKANLDLVRVGMICIFILTLGRVYPQISNDDYIPLKSFGEVPMDFIKSAKEKYEDSKLTISDSDPKKEKLLKDKFFVHSSYSMDNLIYGGKVSFGDPITQYINEVAAFLLKDHPKLKKELRFYTLKSSAVNATCTSPGMIFLNIGLIAKLENEAQLAFIIGHEMSHFKENHSLDFYLEKNDALEGEGKYNRTPYDKRIDNLTKYSQSHEYEADSIGVQFINKTKYAGNEVLGALSGLHYSYLPFKEKKFPVTFFNNNEFNIPECFFTRKFDSISMVTEDYDRFSTHPNIKKRLNAAEGMLKSPDGEKFIISKDKFLKIRDLARFEIVRLQLFSALYGDAIFSAHLLLEDYPNNKYLKICIAKALYGLTKYKNRGKFFKVARSFNSVEGTSQQIHFFLRQLSKAQLNSISLNYVLNLLEKYPNNNYLNIVKKDLVNELVFYSKLALDDFYDIEPDTNPDEENLFKTYLESDEKDKSLLLKVQRKHKNFFKHTLIGKKEKHQLKDLFEKAFEKKEKDDKYKNLDYKDKLKIAEAKNKEIEKNGSGLNAQKLLLLDPYFKVNSENINRHVEAFEKKILLNTCLKEIGKSHNISINTFSSLDLKKSTPEQYNKLCVFKEWVHEKYIHESLNMIPSNHDLIEPFVKDNFELMSYSGIYLNYKNNSGYYYHDVFDLKTGKKKYENMNYINTKIKEKELRKKIETDYLKIKQ